jgi:hypothetical protein
LKILFKNILLFLKVILIISFLIFNSSCSLERLSFRRSDHTKIRFLKKEQIEKLSKNDTLNYNNINFIKLTSKKLINLANESDSRILCLAAAWCPYSEYNLYLIDKFSDSVKYQTDYIFMSYDIKYYSKKIKDLGLKGNFYIIDYEVDNAKFQYIKILNFFGIKKDKDVITMPTNLIFKNGNLLCYTFGLINKADFNLLIR